MELDTVTDIKEVVTLLDVSTAWAVMTWAALDREAVFKRNVQLDVPAAF